MTNRTKILITGVPCLILLVLIVIPNVVPPRIVRSQNACINNLRQLEGAKDQWMLDHHKTRNDIPTWEDLRPYLNGQHVPLTCPAGGNYKIGKVAEQPTCTAHTEYN